MRLEVLQEFCEVANRLNISSTADSVNIAQPALSKHMAELEKEIGFKLFIRERKLRLTPAGKVYFAAAAKMLYVHRVALDDCATLEREKISELRIFKPFVHDEGALALLKASREFVRNEPLVPIQYVSPRGRTPEECIKEDRADFAITVLGGDYEQAIDKAERDGVCIVPFMTARLYAWMSKEALGKIPSAVNLRWLSTCNLMMPANRCFDSMRSSIHGIFKAAGMHPPVDTCVVPVNTLQEFFLQTDDSTVILLTPTVASDPTVAMCDDMALCEVCDEEASLTFAYAYKADTDNPNVFKLIDLIESL